MHGWLIAALLAQSLDLTTTVMKLHDGGCREANPAITAIGLTTGPRIVMLKGGVAASYVWVWSADRRQHATAVRVVSSIVMSSSLVAGIHNLSVNCKR